MEILIIEDEFDILNGMKEAVQRLSNRIRHVYAVGSAEIALEIIEEHNPEIIVTDIVLPQMTGLDLMEQIRDNDYNPKIVVISGYSNFQYAQRSIKLGAVDYMLKPFAQQEFIQKMKSVIDMIEEEEALGKLIRQSSNLAVGTRTLRDKFFLGLCMNPVPLNENTVHRLKFFDMEWLSGSSYSIIAIDRIEQAKLQLTEKEIELKVFAVGNVVEEILQRYQPSVLVRNIHHQWIIVTACDQTDEMADALSAAILKYQYIDVIVGISDRMNAFQAIARAYEQALKAMKLAHINKQGHKLRFAEIANVAEESGHRTEYEQMADYVYMDQPERIESAVTIVLHGLAVAAGSNNRQALSQQCVEWIIHIHSTLSDKLKIKLNQISIQLWVEIEQCGDFGQLRAYMINYFQELSRQITAAPMNPIVEKAILILNAHYAKQITLQCLAAELSVHPVWLSQLFKRETKVTFSHYLTDLRMTEAARLLRESAMKIYEIAEKVGYSDLQHFGQVFKKNMGTTPKEYRQGL